MNLAGEFVASKAVIHLILYSTLKYIAGMPRCCFELLQLLRSLWIGPRYTTITNKTQPFFWKYADFTSYATCTWHFVTFFFSYSLGVYISSRASEDFSGSHIPNFQSRMFRASETSARAGSQWRGWNIYLHWTQRDYSKMRKLNEICHLARSTIIKRPTRLNEQMRCVI